MQSNPTVAASRIRAGQRYVLSTRESPHFDSTATPHEACTISNELKRYGSSLSGWGTGPQSCPADCLHSQGVYFLQYDSLDCLAPPLGQRNTMGSEMDEALKALWLNYVSSYNFCMSPDLLCRLLFNFQWLPLCS